MSIYFYSDPHFNHKNVIDFCDRPYDTLEEMNNTMIQLYNQVVQKDDTCIWLGDCFWGSKSSQKEILAKLNGKKILVIGNHDSNEKSMTNIGFDFVCRRLFRKIAGKKVWLSHYPAKISLLKYFWLTKVKGYKIRHNDRRIALKNDEYLLHGHTHDKQKTKPYNKRCIHVGVDAWNFKPVSINQIERLLNQKS